MADDKLSKYKARRDFEMTKEPSGAGDVKPSNRLHFVIQKHDATRLHYDLRMELDGVFKSWAVTKGPSLYPADKRLAVELEDHPPTMVTSKGPSRKASTAAAAESVGADVAEADGSVPSEDTNVAVVAAPDAAKLEPAVEGTARRQRSRNKNSEALVVAQFSPATPTVSDPTMSWTMRSGGLRGQLASKLRTQNAQLRKMLERFERLTRKDPLPPRVNTEI